MEIFISNDNDDDDLSIEANYILMVSDDSIFIGGLLSTSDIIEAISRLIVASHISAKDLEDSRYTLKRYIEDIVDECFYIKEQLENDDFTMNQKESHTTIFVDLNALRNQIDKTTELPKNLNEDSKDEDLDNKDDSI